MSYLDQDVQYLKGVGEKKAAMLSKLGINSLRDILSYYPRAYEDFSNPKTISQAVPGAVCCIKAAADTPVRESMIRRGMTIYRLRASDSTGRIEITFFNNRYIKDMILQNQEYLFYGKVTGGPFVKQMASPEFCAPKDTGLKPLYRLTEGINSRTLRKIALQAVTLCSEELYDPLPDPLRQKYGLCHKRFAVSNIHFPKDEDSLASARRRLAFEELLTLQLGMRLIKDNNIKKTSAVCTQRDFNEFFKILPFELTAAQKRAVCEAASDMMRDAPMNRLLQGDVGSGKTAVAAALCWYASKNGFQSALMAPTSILASQHFINLEPLFSKCGLKTAILTGSISAGEKQSIKKKLSEHELDIIIGTHALLQENVAFSSLGLVITDEQHRFGVSQRAVLSGKGANPHTLIMSATPIPRTLALFIYGDLEISVLGELPAGRRKTETYFVDSSKRHRVYDFIKKHLCKGFQAFIICPLIEEGADGLASAEDYAQKIASGEFSQYSVGLLHGRLKAHEKDAVMRDFAEGRYNLLVSTTVVEVGVDIPNAVIMVVENAECFGLSQLHQLRGRVGRGKSKSYCIFISDTKSKETAERLKMMCKNSDGFKIAEEDLKMRGPGDFFGSRQHGLPELKTAGLFSDINMLNETRNAAKEILECDPRLQKPENEGLKKSIDYLFRNENVVYN